MAQQISEGFAAALVAPRQHPIAKVEVLDASTRSVVDTITDIEEGSVTVDVSRGTRRTVQLRLTNEDGRYSQVSAASTFSFSHLLRPYRGLRYLDADGTTVEEYVPLGTFMIDRPEVFVERNMSVITIDGSDLWKKIATGGFSTGQSFAVGTNINTVLSQAAQASGIGSAYLKFDQLLGRTSSYKTLGATFAWEPGDSRADFFTNFAVQWGLQVFFDPMGFLVTEEMPNPTTTPPVWSFSAGEDSILLGLTKINSDLKLFNHIIVTGEASGGVPSVARYEIVDNNPGSPTYTGSIGDRVMLYASPQVTTNEQAKVVAEKLYRENCLIEEELKVPTICLPHLEGNDVIEVREPTWSHVSDRYLCQRFDIPLRESRMTIETKKGRPMP